MERVEETIDGEGFRACVGIILSRAGGEVLWARCIKNQGWQFPQGGIEIGETAEEALFRELQEEVGLVHDEVRILGRTEQWLRYRLPPRYQRKQGPRCIGQKQIWFVLELTAPEETIRLNAVDHPEFDNWCWVDWWHALGDAIFFKQRVYDLALTELAPFVFPAGAPPRPRHRNGHGGRWLAPRSPYRIKRAGPRQGSR